MCAYTCVRACVRVRACVHAKEEAAPDTVYHLADWSASIPLSAHAVALPFARDTLTAELPYAIKLLHT